MATVTTTTYEFNIGRNVMVSDGIHKELKVNFIEPKDVIQYLQREWAMMDIVGLGIIPASEGNSEETIYLKVEAPIMDQLSMRLVADEFARYLQQAAIPMLKGRVVGVMGLNKVLMGECWQDEWSEFNANFFQRI